MRAFVNGLGRFQSNRGGISTAFFLWFFQVHLPWNDVRLPFGAKEIILINHEQALLLKYRNSHLLAASDQG
jgi:hypothetical protein